MGCSKKVQVHDHMAAGIPLRASLKPIYTKPVVGTERDGDPLTNEENSTTPKGEESRINLRVLDCPPAPRKRKSSLKYFNMYGGVRQFLSPPDLDTVFIRRHVERANS